MNMDQRRSGIRGEYESRKERDMLFAVWRRDIGGNRRQAFLFERMV